MTALLRLNYYSIGYISGTVFSAFLIIYLLSLKEKTRQTWLLIAYFFFTFIFNFGFVLRAIIFSPDIAKPASFLIALYTCFANFVLASFIYSFPRNINRRESRIVSILLIFAGIFGYAYYLLKNVDSPVTYNFESQLYEFQSPQSTAPMGILHFLTFVWILIVIFRKTNKEERSFKKTKTGFFQLFSPHARRLRSFGFAIFIHTCFSVVYVLYATKNIPFTYFQIFLTSATSIQLFLYTVIYLNNSPQPSSFMIKIVGVTLVFTLTILGIVSRVMFQINETYFDKLRNMEIESALRNINKLNNTNAPEGILYIGSQSFGSNSLSISAPKIEYKTREIIETKNLFQSENGEIQKFIDETKLKTTEKKKIGEIKEDSLNHISERMYRSLTLENGENLLLIRYLIQNQNVIYEIAYSFPSYLDAVHSIVSKMLILIFITAALICLLFPYLFHGGLIRPLRVLLKGVKEVNEGKYDIVVPVQAEDEIGFLSKSFNRMVESIRSAQEKLQDFAETLEEKVIERTNELRQSLITVQELKMKQDADYYLTSLLIQPLSQNVSNSENVFVEFLTEQKKKFKFKRQSSEIGGDLCVSSKIILKEKNYTAILNGDAMGKSMQGAGGALVLGSVFKAILERSRYLDITNLFPEQWLKNTFIELHNIFKTFDGTMMASGFIALLEDDTGFLYYINAAHPLPVCYRNGTAFFLPHKFHYRKLGMPSNKESEVFINTVRLLPEDTLIIASDGRDDILVQENGEINMNGNEDFFLNCVEKGKGSLQNILEEIKGAGEITDDVSLIRIEYKWTNKPVESESERVNKIYAEARQEFRQKNYESTISLLEGISSEIRSEQSNRDVLKLLISAYIQKKDFRKAIETSQRYNDIVPEDSETLITISECYKQLGNLKYARDFGERFRLRDPEHKANLELLTEIYQNLGESNRL